MNENLRVQITKAELDAAAQAGAMSVHDVESLWYYLADKELAQAAEPEKVGSSKFDLGKLAWYSGATLVLIAMAWLVERVGTAYGELAVCFMVVAYAIGFSFLGYKLRFADGLKTPGGILYALAVLMVPPAYMSLVVATGFGDSLSDSGLALSVELLTLAVALPTIYFVRSSVLSAVIYFILWSSSMTIAEIFAHPAYGSLGGLFSNYYLTVSMVVGLGIIISAVVVDLKFGRTEDYSYWGYLFGVAAFWVSLSLFDSGSEFGKFLYFLINQGLMVASILLRRTVFLWAGAVGSIWYIGYVLYSFFSGSILFPIVLIILGLAVIICGIKYRRHQPVIEAYFAAFLPEVVRQRLPGQ
jgi:hypothetical protein